MPFWLTLGIAGISSGELPGAAQLAQSFIVAVFSGVVATLLFFKATELVKDNVRQLAVIESPQAGEVVFTLLGGVMVFNDVVPTLAGFAGIAILVAVMLINGLLSATAADP